MWYQSRTHILNDQVLQSIRNDLPKISCSVSSIYNERNRKSEFGENILKLFRSSIVSYNLSFHAGPT
jgi:hypothetical protein